MTHHERNTVSPERARQLSLVLAARCDLDPRTARRAIERGVDSLRAWHARLRVAEVVAELGLRLPLKVEPRRRTL